MNKEAYGNGVLSDNSLDSYLKESENDDQDFLSEEVDSLIDDDDDYDSDYKEKILSKRRAEIKPTNLIDTADDLSLIHI